MTESYVPLPGDIGLTSISGWAGRGIRVGQWLVGDGFSRYEHAFVYVGSQKIIEAEPGGALLSDLKRYDPSRVMWLRCPQQYRLDVTRAALGYGPDPATGRKGVGYSWLDYAAIGERRFHVPTPGLEAYIRSSGHMICSQLADRSAMDGGWHLFEDGRWEGDVTPGDLWKLALAQERARQEA
jgi:hypothetical protein